MHRIAYHQVAENTAYGWWYTPSVMIYSLFARYTRKKRMIYQVCDLDKKITAFKEAVIFWWTVAPCAHWGLRGKLGFCYSSVGRDELRNILPLAECEPHSRRCVRWSSHGFANKKRQPQGLPLKQRVGFAIRRSNTPNNAIYRLRGMRTTFTQMREVVEPRLHQ